MTLFLGFLLGLGSVLLIGPVVLVLLQNTIHHGKKAGFFVAFGIIFSDLIAVTLCYFGYAKLFQEGPNETLIKTIGSIILLILSAVYFFKSPSISEAKNKLNKRQLTSFFAQGFSINFFNPVVFFIWLTALHYAKTTFVDKLLVLQFIIGALMGILTMDSLKVLFASKIKRFVTPNNVQLINRIVALILLVFAVKLYFF